MPLSDMDGWITSSRSSGGDNCVQAKPLPDGTTVVRHSKHPHELNLSFLSHTWSDLLDAIRATDFPSQTAEWTPANPFGQPTAQARTIADGHVEFTHTDATPSQVLTFTPGEWFAFTQGIRDGEFMWKPPTVA